MSQKEFVVGFALCKMHKRPWSPRAKTRGLQQCFDCEEPVTTFYEQLVGLCREHIFKRELENQGSVVSHLRSVGALTGGQLTRASEQQQRGIPLLRAIWRAPDIDEQILLRGLSARTGLPQLELDEVTPTPDSLKMINGETALRHFVVPLTAARDSMTAAVCDPTNRALTPELSKRPIARIDLALATYSAISRAVEKHYGLATEREVSAPAEVFLSYAREDRAAAKLIAEAIGRRHTVFWDRWLEGGDDFAGVIELALEKCKCVVVIWSARSRVSDWVRDEARVGKENNALVPVVLGKAKPPLGYQSDHLTNFISPESDQGDAMRSIVDQVSRIVRRKPR